MNFRNHLQGISISRLTGLIRKEFILITRDRGTIAMLVILPMLWLAAMRQLKWGPLRQCVNLNLKEFHKIFVPK
jgi:hypothetical protein